MKNIYLFCCISIVLSCTPDHKQPLSPEQNPFQWLAGSWEIKTDSMLVAEQWTVTHPGQMDGIAYAVSGQDTLFHETIRIEKMGGQWVYIAKVNKNQPILFAAQKGANAESIVFENKEHDFPQRVSYIRKGQYSCTAVIEGPVNGKQEKESYNYTRVGH